MNRFVVGDRVRIVTNKHGQAGELFVIDEVEGSDEVGHELPYRGKNGYWYNAVDLVMVQPAYAKEYAIGKDTEAQPADAPAVDGVSYVLCPNCAAAWGGEEMTLERCFNCGFNAEMNAQVAALREQLAAITAERDAAVRVSVRLSGEYERGWKGATESMLSIIERTLENPAGHKLTHIETLVKRFRIDYPKHGVRATSE